MKINLSTIVLLIIAAALGAYGMNAYNKSPRPSKIKVKDRETISHIFASGCEVGVMKSCDPDPKKMQECRNFCVLFVDTNPKVIDLLLEGLEKNVP